MMDLMKMLTDPEAMAAAGQGVSGITTTLQEISDAVKLQNRISAYLLIVTYREKQIEAPDWLLAVAMGVPSTTPLPSPTDPA
jgi:hypothetical protein